jgi:hypothetical protein
MVSGLVNLSSFLANKSMAVVITNIKKAIVLDNTLGGAKQGTESIHTTTLTKARKNTMKVPIPMPDTVEAGVSMAAGDNVELIIYC